MENIILEYSEKQGSFHFNDGKTEQNTNGFVTISSNINRSTALNFISHIHQISEFVSLAQVQTEFQSFCL